MRINSVFFIIISISIFFTSPGSVWSETAKEALVDSDTSGQIIIRRSDNFNLDNKDGTADLSGNVEITFLSGDVKTRWDNMTLNCENLKIYYETDNKAQDTEDFNASINRIVATGDVKISQSDGSLFTAEKAEYFRSEEKIDLTGSPVFKRGNSHVEGSKLTIYLMQDTVSGEDIKANLIMDEKR